MFSKSCDRLYDQLSAIECLSTDPGERQLNRRGKRLLDYLRARRRRRYQDDRHLAA